AHDQWATRPDDERFATLTEMYADAKAGRGAAAHADVRQGELKVAPTPRGLAIVGKEGNAAVMTHWSFDQVCNRLAAPAWYLRTLSAELAAANLNFCIKDDENDDAELS